MASAGTLWVSVKPSLEGFGQSVRQQLRDQVPGDQTVKLSGDARDLQAKLAEAKAKLDELNKLRVDPKIDADATALETAIEQAKAKLRDLQAQKTDPKVELDAAVVEARIAQITAKLDELNAKKSTPKIEADKQALEAALAQANAKLDALNAKRVDPKVTAQGITETEADIATLTAQLDALGDKRTSTEVRAQIAEAEAEVASYSAQLDALNGKRVSTKVDADTSGAQASTFSLMSALVALGPAATTAGIVAAAGMGAVGNAAIAGVAGVGTLKLAFEGIGGTLKQYDTVQKDIATHSSGTAKAQQELARQMGELAPPARDFVNIYERELKPKLDDLKKTAQQGLFPGLNSGIRSALPVFNQLDTIVKNVSRTFGDLSERAGKALTDPFWRSFFTFVGNTAAPTIRTLAETFGNFVKAAAGVMQALYRPVFLPIMSWFKELSERVAKFGEEAAAGKSAGFNKFLDYVRDNGPKVAELLRQAWELFKKIGEALAAAGPSELSLLIDVFKFINTLPQPVINELVDLFVAAKLWALVKVPVNGIRDAYTGIKQIADKLAEMKAAGGLKGALGATGQLVGGIAAGGAVVVGLGAAGQWYTANVDAPLQRDPKTGKPVTAQQQSLGQSASSVAAGTLNQYNQNPLEAFNKPFEPGSLKWWTGSTGPEMGDRLKNSFVGKLSTGMDKTVGKWLDDNVSNPFKDFFAKLPGRVSKWWDDDVWGPTSRWFSSLPGKISKGWTDNVSGPTGRFFSSLPGRISKWWDDNVSGPTGRFFSGLPGKISKWWTDNVSGPTGRFFSSLPGRISKWWDDNVSGPTGRFFSGLPGRISKWWTDNVSGPTGRFFASLPGRISKWWEDNVSGPTGRFFSGLPGRISKWWNDNVSGPTGRFFSGLPGRISKWWEDNVSGPTGRFFAGLPGRVSKWWEDHVAGPTGRFFSGLPGRVSKWWTDNVETPARNWFYALPGKISRWWEDNIAGPTGRFFAGLPGRVNRWWVDNVETPTVNWFRSMWQKVSTWWNDNIATPITTAAQRMADGVARSFASIRRAAAVPVNFVVQTVYGHGIKPAWDWVAGLVGLPPLPPPGPPIPELAAGTDRIPAARVGSGFVTDGPRAIVGEGGPHPEFVVPTDPAHRTRALGLYDLLGQQLGGPMLATGGILGPLGGIPVNAGVGGTAQGAVQGPLAQAGDWFASKAAQIASGAAALFADPIKFIKDLMGGVGAGLDRFAGSGIGQDEIHLVPKIIDSLAGKAKAGVDAMMASMAGGGSAMMGPIGDGQIFVIQQISDSARAHGVGFPGDVIGVATGIVESGLRNLNYGDRDSVGVFQQRGNGAWGSLPERMNVRHAADMFFNKLVSFNWRAMDPGAAAQKVQVSAFPGRYSQVMGQAADLVRRYGGTFDQGGMLQPGITTAINASGKPERVLTADQNHAFERMVAHATGKGNQTGGGATLNFPNAVFRDPVDVDLVMSRAHFATTAKRF